MAKTKGGNASGRRLQVDYMTRTERVQAAVNGAEVDRVPVCFWHHFQPEGSGRAMAEATLRFFDDEFALDIAKVMPDLPYPFPRKSISSVEDWRLIEPIDLVRSRYFRERAEAIAILRDARLRHSGDHDCLQSDGEAMYAARDRDQFLAHLREHPVVIHEALPPLPRTGAHARRHRRRSGRHLLRLAGLLPHHHDRAAISGVRAAVRSRGAARGVERLAEHPARAW